MDRRMGPGGLVVSIYPDRNSDCDAKLLNTLKWKMDISTALNTKLVLAVLVCIQC